MKQESLAAMDNDKSKDLSLLQRLFSCFKSQRKDSENHARNKLLKWHCRQKSLRCGTECDNTTELIPLATWPGQQLQSTVEATIAEGSVTSDLVFVSTIHREIESELQESCPFEVKDQYDFCMICSESDVCEAEKLTEDLSDQYRLTGHLVWNSVHLGADQFTVFEDVIERSSVVIYYITKTFTEDRFCCHIARTRLVIPAEISGTGRDIPLLIDPDIKLPESLRLVQKLTLQYVGAQFPKIFTDKVRFKKIERQVQCEMLTDGKRLSLVRDAVKCVNVR
jgi:hypothetical protein